jgi:16S rRNA (cytosine1402-N4)-methyltransferase
VEAFAHQPVLREEVLQALDVRAGGIYVDATFGRGGHARAILDRIGPQGRLLALDRDPAAAAAARAMFAGDERAAIVRGRFSMLEQIVEKRGWLGKVDGIVLDLGVSSPQLDDPQRGFSFLRDGPLDMRMDSESGESAAHWLAGASEREIADVLHDYGEERYARRIARAICRERRERAIATTGQLAAIVAHALPRHEPGQHPATRTFQALRIQVNRELEELRAVLPQALRVLRPGGRLAVVSFHSLEDRTVKQFFRDQAHGDRFPPGLPVTRAQLRPSLRLVGRAQRPGAAEIERNPRARSAVLRVAERLAPEGDFG